MNRDSTILEYKKALFITLIYCHFISMIVRTLINVFLPLPNPLHQPFLGNFQAANKQYPYGHDKLLYATIHAHSHPWIQPE